jgi:two-component system phosphate regulon sensor histidine kinase PhoR
MIAYNKNLNFILSISTASIVLLATVSSSPIWFTLVIILSQIFIILCIESVRNKKNKNLTTNGKNTSMTNALLGIMDNISYGAVIIDKNQNIMYANKFAHEIFGNKSNNKQTFVFIKEPNVKSWIEKSFNSGFSNPITYLVEKPINRHVRLLLSPLPVSDKSSKENLAVIFLNDITEYIFMQSQRTDFLANASHELKTPVASLLGYIETLEGHAKHDEKAREKFLGIMHIQAERMQHLINDLLILLKIEQIEHIIPQESVDLSHAVETAVEALNPLAIKKNISINFSSNGPKIVKANSDELVQVVLNLVDNALKISEQNTQINLSITRDEKNKSFAGTGIKDLNKRVIVETSEPNINFYCLKIKDNGPGFAKDHIPRIGERFYRITGDLGSKEKGTGLGLAIVKHIIMRHRGRLELITAEGVGSEFCISLPAAK